MTTIYKLLAIAMVLIGALVLAKATQHAFQMEKVTLPMHCTNDGCRVIFADGTLSKSTYPQPSEVSR